MEITKESTLEEILKHPKGKEVLAKYSVPCLGCSMASMEIKFLKIGDVAKKYGLDLDSILEELNEDEE